MGKGARLAEGRSLDDASASAGNGSRTSSGAPPHDHRAEGIHETVDPGYWPRSLGLRILIAVCYVALVPAGLLPMSFAWWAVSGLPFLAYSIGAYILYIRAGGTVIHAKVFPYADTLVVTIAIIALARPEYPLWMGYFLLLPVLATFHSSRYVMGFACWTIANTWAAFGILSITGRAEFGWQFAAVISFMGIFTAMNGDIVAVSNRKLRQMVREAALTDPLTGLANRRTFDDRLMIEMDLARRSVRPIAVVLFDVDHFKAINDEHGHPEGDRVLVELAALARSVARAGELIARVGGEEFAWLLPGAGADGAHASADRLRVAVASGELGPAAQVTVSLGAAVWYPTHGESRDDLLSRADAALYRAKRAGRDRVEVAGAPSEGD